MIINKNIITQRFQLIFIVVFILILAISPVVAAAVESVGKVDALAGLVTATMTDGSARKLKKGSQIFSGDVINTNSNSRVRLIFSDDGVVFLRPSTKFVIDSYQYTGNIKQDESKFSLVKGGFRALTGAIGKGNKSRVKISTPVATIGIRGTDHEARYCADDCRDFATGGGKIPVDGLYTGTNTGRTLIGGKLFGPGQFGFTAAGLETIHLVQPPAILVKDADLRGALGSLSGRIYIPAKPPKAVSVRCR